MAPKIDKGTGRHARWSSGQNFLVRDANCEVFGLFSLIVTQPATNRPNPLRQNDNKITASTSSTSQSSRHLTSVGNLIHRVQLASLQTRAHRIDMLVHLLLRSRVIRHSRILHIPPLFPSIKNKPDSKPDESYQRNAANDGSGYPCLTSCIFRSWRLSWCR